MMDRNKEKIVLQHLKEIYNIDASTLSKSLATNGIHALTGTSISPTGNYQGFVVTGDSTVIEGIAIIDRTKFSGDFLSITLIQGAWYPIPFTTIKLTSGDMLLIK